MGITVKRRTTLHVSDIYDNDLSRIVNIIFRDQTEIKVLVHGSSRMQNIPMLTENFRMPWDLDSLKPEIKLPQPASHDLLAFRSPEHDWKVIQHWTPLKATVHERYEYFGISTPHEPVAAQPTALCNGCDEIIFGPRFICCLCTQKDFNWCWSCISDPAEQHPTNHPFVRIDSSVDEDDYRQRNEVARALVATNSVSSVSSGTNFVHEITSEVIHEVDSRSLSFCHLEVYALKMTD